MINVNKYPKIIMDETNQAVNPSCKKNITVEEWNDLLHHTHSEFNTGGTGGGGSDVDLTEVIQAINNLTNLIQNQNNDIVTMKEKIEKIEAYIDQDIQIGDISNT